MKKNLITEANKWMDEEEVNISIETGEDEENEEKDSNICDEIEEEMNGVCKEEEELTDESEDKFVRIAPNGMIHVYENGEKIATYFYSKGDEDFWKKNGYKVTYYTSQPEYRSEV